MWQLFKIAIWGVWMSNPEGLVGMASIGIGPANFESKSAEQHLKTTMGKNNPIVETLTP